MEPPPPPVGKMVAAAVKSAVTFWVGPEIVIRSLKQIGEPGKAPNAVQIVKFHCEGVGDISVLSANDTVKFPAPSQKIGTTVWKVDPPSKYGPAPGMEFCPTNEAEPVQLRYNDPLVSLTWAVTVVC